MPEPTDRPRRRWTLAISLACALAAALPVTPAFPPEADADRDGTDGAEQGVDPRQVPVVLASLDVRLQIVNDLLLDAGRNYRKTAIERGSVQQELTDSLERLDRDAVRARELGRERLDQLQAEVERNRHRLAVLLDEMMRRLEDMRRLITERDELTRRIADMRGSVTSTAREPLTGAWEVTWMPAGISGTFYLDQSGTLVTGQYKLGAATTGSLQGTFVSGKLYLQRIDAQRGRDAEIEGVLDPDGTRIRGTWQNFELVHGGLPRGTWTAKRVR